MFNGKVMEKVRFLADNLSMDDLMHIDFKVGQDPNMPRIDRIFSYMKLDMLGREKQKELDMTVDLIPGALTINHEEPGRLQGEGRLQDDSVSFGRILLGEDQR